MQDMTYSVFIEGSSNKKDINASDAWEAAREYARQVGLPSNGVLVVSGAGIVKFPVINGIIQSPTQIPPIPAPVLPSLPPLPTASFPPPPPPPGSPAYPQDSAGDGDQNCEPNRTYPALRIICVLLKILAIILALSSVISGIVLANNCGRHNEGMAALFVVGGIVGGFLTWVIFWGIAELIRVFLDIESNTRRHKRS
jgi:hypothetical protein